MKKVLILTAGFGEGHNAAARNLRDALEHLSDDVKVEVLDLFALTVPAHQSRGRRLVKAAPGEVRDDGVKPLARRDDGLPCVWPVDESGAVWTHTGSGLRRFLASLKPGWRTAPPLARDLIERQIRDPLEQREPRTMVTAPEP